MAVDPSEFPSAYHFCLAKTIALNIRFVLHLFSGQRRDQDLQHEFESLHAQQNRFLGNVLVLSIDIVLHLQIG